jgi:ribosome modulation factor
MAAALSSSLVLGRGGLPNPVKQGASPMHATIGDNSKDLTPSEAKALYMHHFQAILAQTEKCKAENAERARLRKLAKADGVILADIDFGLRCATLEDPQVIVDEQRRRAEIGRYFALPIGAQTEMDFDREPIIERAAREGEAAGFAGKNADTVPYDENSDPGRAWTEGWKKAQAQMLADLEAAMLKKQAARADADASNDTGENDPDEDDDEDSDE